VWALRRWKDAAVRLFGLFLSPRRWKERLLNLGMGLMGSLALASSALLLTRVGGRGLASRLRPAGGLEDAHFLIQIQAGLAGVAVPILLLILERMGEDEILPISRALIRRTLAFPLIFYALGGLAALLCLPEPPFAFFTVLLTCLGLLFAYGRAAVAARDPDALREEALELLRRDGQRQNQYAVQARLERIAQEGRRAAQEGAWRRVEEALKAWKSLAWGLAEQLERDLNRAYGRHEREKRLSRAAESGRLIARALDPLAPALARLREEPELLERLLNLPEEFLAQRPDRLGEGLARWAAGLQVMVRLYPRLPPDARRRAAEEWAHAMSYEEGLWSGRDPDRIALLVWAAAGLGAAALLEEDEDAWSFLGLPPGGPRAPRPRKPSFPDRPPRRKRAGRRRPIGPPRILLAPTRILLRRDSVQGMNPAHRGPGGRPPHHPDGRGDRRERLRSEGLTAVTNDFVIICFGGRGRRAAWERRKPSRTV
jgi:hypothetical protein